MTWQDGKLKNPLSGKLLKPDSAHSLSDGDARFPVIAEIPFLRVNRDELQTETLQALDLGDERAALTLLLQDQDDWAKTAPPDAQDLQPLFDNPNLTLRSAMQCLKYGAVADYFAYRWSDPTFLSGLALLEHHLPPAATRVFELCCGIGHYLREMEMRGITAIGADVVFSKLWLARKFVAPNSRLICFDANADFPFVKNFFDAAFCHDAFYFLPEKQRVAAELKRLTTKTIIIGHAHNREADNFSSGAAVSVEEYAAMFENPILYDDHELTRSIVENRRPQAASVEILRTRPAVAIVRAGQSSRFEFEPEHESFALPLGGRSLRPNPLLENGEQILNSPRYPSERYSDEYAALSDYLELNGTRINFDQQAQFLYGDWYKDKDLRDLARRRVFLDLPENW